MYNELFKDRKEAGKLLSERLIDYKKSDAVVLAIPRGGLPLGYEIAKALQLPLDVALSKKIGHPNNPEFAIGAISLDSVILDDHPEIPESYISSEIDRLRAVLKEKYQFYTSKHAPIDIKGKIVIIVDDGIATGNTILAIIAMLRKKKPKKIIVAVPVVPNDRVEIFEQETDEFIYLLAPDYFSGVGGFYKNFDQVEDAEAIKFLRDANSISSN